jgi:GNAT superfamily N-acetyltransferase
MGVIGAPPVAIDVAACRDLWSAVPAGLAERHGIAHVDLAGGVCLACASLSGTPVVNHAIGLGVTAPAGEAELDELERFYRGVGAAYSVAVDPEAPWLGERLARRGFEAGLPWMRFRREAGRAPASATELTIEDAGSARASAFGSIVAAAFEMPPEFSGWMGALVGRPGWTCLLALDRGEPVGAAALFTRGDTGWLGFGATLPEHRGRGAQGALFAERLRRAHRLGLREVLTETGAPAEGERPGPSYRNMLRYGFAEAGIRPNLRSPTVRPAAAHR